MTNPPRYGITFPFDGIPLLDQRELVRELVDLGYTDLWSAESGGYDAFIPLAVAAQWAPELRFGTAIVPAYTRGAHTLASTVASMCQAAPGHFALGIGTSSDVIVERWNGLTFDKPYQRVRDTIRFLRAALTGEKVDEEYETFRVRGFRLGIPVPDQPPILVAALREGMLRLAGRDGDGAIVNWLSADDVKTVAPHVGAEKEIAARTNCTTSFARWRDNSGSYSTQRFATPRSAHAPVRLRASISSGGLQVHILVTHMGEVQLDESTYQPPTGIELGALQGETRGG